MGLYMVRSLYEDGAGTLWIGTCDAGLYRFRKGRFTAFTVRDGLFNNGVFQILEDASGHFWISCNLGIYRVSKKELDDFAEGRARKITAIPYSKREGMLNQECNSGNQPAGIKAADGRFCSLPLSSTLSITWHSKPLRLSGQTRRVIFLRHQ